MIGLLCFVIAVLLVVCWQQWRRIKELEATKEALRLKLRAELDAREGVDSARH